jgi:hypothetical protein
MQDPRAAASLNSGLLARRGDARPAMRRQSPNSVHAPQISSDDLGWNDIGDHQLGMGASTPAARVDELSPVINQIVEIAERMAQPVRSKSLKAAPQKTEPKAKRAAELAPKPMVDNQSKGQLVASSIGRKAAFTLRLDPERHLRLRLLSAVSHRSAQQLLIEALDALLAQHDDVEDLAGQVQSGKKKTTVKAGSK